MKGRAEKPKVTMVDVPKTMMELADRRGSAHLVKYRSIEQNMGAAYLQGFHDALIASDALAQRTTP